MIFVVSIFDIFERFKTYPRGTSHENIKKSQTSTHPNASPLNSKKMVISSHDISMQSLCSRSHEVYMFVVILVVPGCIMGLSYIFIIRQIQVL
jgi:hypothetical protein